MPTIEIRTSAVASGGTRARRGHARGGPRRHRPARPERGGQDDAAAGAGDGARARRRARPAARPRPAGATTSASRSAGGSATCRRSRASTAGFTTFEFLDYVAILKELHRPAGAARRGAPRARELVDLTDAPGHGASGRCRAACAGASRSRRRCSASRICWCSTSRRPASTRSSGCASASSSPPGRAPHVIVSTHQTEDVAALCARVVVLHGGCVRFAGTPGRARGRGARPRVARRPSGRPARTAAWRMADGRCCAAAWGRPAAEPAEPTLEDGYMLLLAGCGRGLGAAA